MRISNLMQTRLIITVLMGLLVLPLMAQVEFAYEDFELINQPHGVEVRWTITAGNTCNGTTIQRSLDSVNFFRVGEIAGICGDSLVSVPYDHFDPSAESNRTNYYRLYLGGLGYSEVKSIAHVRSSEKAYTVVRNTATGERTIYFSNPNFHETEVQVFNALGQLLYQAKTNTNQVDIPALTTSAHVDILFVQLYREEKLIGQGKL